MGETAVHAGLVEALVAYAATELGGLVNLSIRNDAVRPLRGERPPRINGYVPDVFATDVPTTATLIGEAKTRADLETAHTQDQIHAFLDYLSQTPNGIFVLSVPLSAAATGRRLIARLKTPFSTAETRIVVIDGISVMRC
ncbi:hypothetical protein N2597_22435 (plasmid) [Rhizobium sophoriradicis]|uniref:hypothetical protein n=1 Tax=Rhizobium sophoriradicis TaxID=1535245 RepID=UPI001621391E|nr:hypothetical protein N2597_22435 [Rhizobium leguminosarum bv. phaseoli]